jgi:NADH-quinone oxidoreductase subunit J
MNALLAGAGLVAVASTLAVVLQRKAVHALLYLIVSFFALAVAMLALGAAFAAALEVVVYAGAILVLFVFVVMMLGSGDPSRPAAGTGLRAWIGPSLLSLLLLGELGYAFIAEPSLLGGVGLAANAASSPKDVGRSLLGVYAIGSEIAAFLLLSGLVGAYHIAKREAAPRSAGGGK